MTYFTLCLSFFVFSLFRNTKLTLATLPLHLAWAPHALLSFSFLSLCISQFLLLHKIQFSTSNQTKTENEAKRRQRAEGFLPFTSLCLFFILHHHFISPLSLSLSFSLFHLFCWEERDNNYNYSNITITITITITRNNQQPCLIPIYLSLYNQTFSYTPPSPVTHDLAFCEL